MVPSMIFKLTYKCGHLVHQVLQFDIILICLVSRQFHQSGIAFQNTFEFLVSVEYFSFGGEFVLLDLLTHHQALALLLEGHELVLILDLF